MLSEFDCVRLTGALDARDVGNGNRIVLGVGTRGCIMIVHASDPPGYEVEFVDSDNRTLAVETVFDSQVELES